MRALSTLTLSLLLGGTALAGPGDLFDTAHPAAAEDAPALTLRDVSKATPCNVRGGMCLTPGGKTTIAVSSAEVVTAAVGAKSSSTPVVPRFSRAAALAGETSAGVSPDENAPWAIDLSANLKRQSWNGNALFVFFDLEDPEAIENRQFTALYQVPVKATSKLAAHVSLVLSEGFRAGHTYRIRIVQLISGKEIILAESDVALM